MGLLDGLIGGAPRAQAPGQSGGLFGDFGSRMTQLQQTNPEAFIALGAGLLNGNMAQGVAGMGDAIGNYRQREAQAGLQREGWDRADARFDKTFGLQQAEFDMKRQALGTERAQRQQQLNQTLRWAESTGDPDVIGLAGAGMFDEAFKVHQAKQGMGGGGDYYGTPVYFEDPKTGQIGVGQFGKGGDFNVPQIPGGGRPLAPADLNREKARGTAVGKGMGEAQTNAPAQVESADQTISLIDDILDDPGLPSATGPLQGMLPSYREDTINTESKIEQLKGRAFAEAIQAMVGLGALSDAEGKAILAGAARLDYRQGDAGFRASLMDLRTQVERGRQRAAQILSGGGQVQRPAPVNVGGYTIEQVD